MGGVNQVRCSTKSEPHSKKSTMLINRAVKRNRRKGVRVVFNYGLLKGLQSKFVLAYLIRFMWKNNNHSR